MVELFINYTLVIVTRCILMEGVQARRQDAVLVVRAGAGAGAGAGWCVLTSDSCTRV